MSLFPIPDRFKLSVYWIWPNALITFIGGGPSVIRAILLTMLGDTLPPSYRYVVVEPAGNIMTVKISRSHKSLVQMCTCI